MYNISIVYNLLVELVGYFSILALLRGILVF